MRQRYFIHTLLLYILSLLSACSGSENDIIELPGTSEYSVTSEGIICTVKPFELQDEQVCTRSSLTKGSSGMVFAWQVGDKITVFSDASNRGDFTLVSQTGQNATFDGGGFHLVAGATYYTISKSITACKDADDKDWHNAPEAFNVDAATNIRVTYEGQRISSNENTDHMGTYDYNAAVGVSDVENHVHFDYNHLGVTLRVKIQSLPVGKKFKSIQMYDASEDAFREMTRYVNILQTPIALKEPVITSESQRLTVALGVKVGEVEQGMEVPSNGILDLFISAPPVDLTGKTIAFRLTPVDGQKITDNGEEKDLKPYFSLIDGKNFVAGKAYQLKMTAEQCTQYKVNVKIVHDWHNGNAVTQTRAAGDPGYEYKDELPTHLYAYFINGGKVVENPTVITDIPSTEWTTKDGISTYTGNTKLTMDNKYKDNPKVYIVASKGALTMPSVTVNTTTETDILAATYSYPTSTQSEAQTYMRALYSTPYTATYKDFVGALTDDVKDVRLYHVASKVDVNWENTTATALTGNVSVNNFPTTSLSLFKPTSANVSGGSATVTTAITPGTAWNGRTVFYLPQPSNNATQPSSATYNVTIGSKTQDIAFTPDPVYTSWFRGLVTIQ